MKRLLIAGIGSHNPGDQLGWQALQALQAIDPGYPGYRVEWRLIEHPAVDLLPALCELDAAVLLDALVGSGARHPSHHFVFGNTYQCVWN